MSILDRFVRRADATAEQLAPDDPAPRGESREDDPTGRSGFVFSFLNRGGIRTSRDTLAVDSSDAPADIKSDWEAYYPFPPVRAALQIFSDTVLEPGVRVEATTAAGETDEEMRDALDLWAENAAIIGGRENQPLTTLLDAIIKRRRGQGTIFMEKVGTEAEPDALSALMLHNPATFRQYARDDQALLIQPDDDVAGGHPRTDDGDAAAFVQYDSHLSGYDDLDPIPFTADDLEKFLYDAEPWGLWGRSIFTSIGPRIDALRQKLEDRDVAIHQTGHPHRIYSSETWTTQEAKEYAEAHKNDEVSVYQDADDAGTFAGRVDFVSDAVEVDAVSGDVADIADAVMDDIEQIFSALPVSKFKIAYEEDINQFVVEPQQEKDALLVDKEREYLEGKFQPLFERKADELAGGSYEGEVRVAIEPDRHENALRRESFPAENLDAFGSFLRDFYTAGADADIPIAAALDKLGMDLSEMRDEFDWEPEEFELTGTDEMPPEMRAQAEAMETDTAPPAATDGGTDEDDADESGGGGANGS